jgi:hypothetical protein
MAPEAMSQQQSNASSPPLAVNKPTLETDEDLDAYLDG